MTKVMSLTAVMALLAQGEAPTPKIPIPQRPLMGHVVISLVKHSVLEQNDHFPIFRYFLPLVSHYDFEEP